MSADGAGYTRLLAADEAATILALREARDAFARSAARHGGRVVDAPGDNVLVELPSALDAVRCSLEAQRVLADRGAATPEDRRMLFRIGVHLGDVAVEGERIYGDGVNVAARLQTLAEPGGICVSGAIYENVRSRLDLPFHDLGEQTLKNFPRPVRAYRIGGAPGDAAPAAPPEPPGQPSLVVLPFANVSGDPEQEYLADGMSEDLITELARVPGLFVIGRGTSFAYKGRSVPAREIGRELGVRHVVEGSVRRAGARVRITARLSDAQSGREVWSERFDRELGDVFALQDEVVGGVVTGLREALGAGLAHEKRERAVSPEVWALAVQARAELERNSPPAAFAARDRLRRCVELDPGLALGWALLARSEYSLHLFHETGEPYLELGVEHVRRALELDPGEPEAHAALAMLLVMRGDHDAAVAASRRSVELAPGRADLRLMLATLLNFVGRPEEAIPVLERLTRVDPAQRYMHLFQIAISYRRLGRIDEAIAKHREALRLYPEFIGPHMNLVAIHASLGELNQARAALADLLRVRPDFSLSRVPRLPTGRDFLVENLRTAGLRE